MKNSILEGAACSAPIQSSDNSPCGRTEGPKKADGLKYKEVVKSNIDRNPTTKGPQFSHNIGGK